MRVMRGAVFDSPILHGGSDSVSRLARKRDLAVPCGGKFCKGFFVKPFFHLVVVEHEACKHLFNFAHMILFGKSLFSLGAKPSAFNLLYKKYINKSIEKRFLYQAIYFYINFVSFWYNY